MAKKSNALPPHETLVEMSVEDMRKPLTEEQRRELEALIAMPDAEIDFSNQPETVGLLRPVKR